MPSVKYPRLVWVRPQALGARQAHRWWPTGTRATTVQVREDVKVLRYPVHRRQPAFRCASLLSAFCTRHARSCPPPVHAASKRLPPPRSPYRHSDWRASAANAVGKMPDVFLASGLLGLAVLFTSVNPAAGFTAFSPQRGPGPVHAPAPDAPPAVSSPSHVAVSSPSHVAVSSPSHCPLLLGSITHEPPV